MTYLNAKGGVADSFVKDVRECCAKLLKEPQTEAGGMVGVISTTCRALASQSRIPYG